MASPARAPLRLLVVDDDLFVQTMLAIELPQVEVIDARNLRDGYRLAVNRQPEAAIVDVRLLDGENGLDLVRRIRETPEIGKIPVIVLTAGHDERHRADVMRAGADDYLAKPFDPSDLATRVRRLLDLKGGGRGQRRHKLLDRLRGGEYVDDLAPIDLTEEARERAEVRGAAEVHPSHWWQRRRAQV